MITFDLHHFDLLSLAKIGREIRKMKKGGKDIDESYRSGRYFLSLKLIQQKRFQGVIYTDRPMLR
jgi:hypothetical protein